MSRISKGELAALAVVEHERTQNTLLTEALSACIQNQTIYINSFTLDGTRVRAYLIHPLRAHGGLILLRFDTRQPNREVHSQFEVHYLEAFSRSKRALVGTSDYQSALAGLAERALSRVRIEWARDERKPSGGYCRETESAPSGNPSGNPL